LDGMLCQTGVGISMLLSLDQGSRVLHRIIA
jgi:hypothetical protein